MHVRCAQTALHYTIIDYAYANLDWTRLEMLLVQAIIHGPPSAVLLFAEAFPYTRR